MARFDAPDVVTIMAEWTSTGDPPRLEKGRPLSAGGIAKIVQDTGRPARVDDYASAARGRQSWVLDSGTRAAVAAPITVDGRLWGVMGVGSRGAPPSSDTEERLAGFTELIATAIANTQAREELRTIADEQAALRRVATLVAGSASGPVVFAAVAEEVGRLLRAERTFLARFDADVVTVVGAWPGSDDSTAMGWHGHLDEAGLSKVVRETNRTARVDRRNEAWAELPSVRELGLKSAVAAPISVQGRIWGMIEVASTSDEPVAPGTEERLAAFTELVATAIANSQARGELSALADEQAALRRVATLVGGGSAAGDGLRGRIDRGRASLRRAVRPAAVRPRRHRDGRRPAGCRRGTAHRDTGPARRAQCGHARLRVRPARARRLVRRGGIEPVDRSGPHGRPRFNRRADPCGRSALGSRRPEFAAQRAIPPGHRGSPRRLRGARGDRHREC
jgi:GAF domain-containing protein